MTSCLKIEPISISSVGVALVRITPGARTAWHTHPKGQTLYVTDGVGYVCHRGEKPQKIKPGDSVFIEPGEEHWHGATPADFMEHLAMLDNADDPAATTRWLEHVTDTQYNTPITAEE